MTAARLQLVAVASIAVAAVGGTLGVAGAARRGGPVAASLPAIDVQPQVGSVLRARSGSWKGRRPLRIGYSWLRCKGGGSTCAPVAGGRTYTVRRADVGSSFRLSVRVANRAGTRVAESRPTPVVAGALGPPTAATAVVDAAGDIACDPTSALFNGGRGSGTNCREKSTSDLIAADHPTVVLPLGDTQYECGRASAYAASYGPTWGRFRAITHPAIGNHEYGRSCGGDDPSPYFDYFGSGAGPRYKGWYSFDVGAWHLIALNSECSYGKQSAPVGGCGPGSPQETWLKGDLARDTATCTLAYWHEPRFSSGEHGDAQQMGRVWNDLVRAHVDVVLSGHNHDYERFEPLGEAPDSTDKFQDPVVSRTGIREFVVGTGGRNTYPFSHPPLAGEVVRDATTFGVLKLTLRATSYTWRFEPVSGGSFTDSGSGSCH